MNNQHNSLSDIVEEIIAGAILVSPNNRIAADFRAEATKLAIEKDIPCFNFTITSIEQLLLQFWEQYTITTTNNIPILINNFQEIAIFHQIIQQSTTEYLLDTINIAKELKDTRDLIKIYQVPNHALSEYQDKNYEYFIRCLHAFEQYLNKHNFLTKSMLTQTICQLIKNNSFTVNEDFIFAGFDEYTPANKFLYNTLANITKVKVYHPEQIDNNSYCYHASDVNQEILAMLAFAREHYLQGKKKIACVIPDLKAKRPLLEYLINEHLLHENQVIPYDISAGSSLIDFNIIKTVRNILYAIDNTDMTLFNAVICSPYIKGYSQESYQRAQLIDFITNKLRATKIEHSKILTYINNHEANYYSPILHKIIQDIIMLNQDLPNTALPSFWIDYTNQLLKIFGWPGDHILNSEEYQVYQKFSTVLTNILSLDVIYNNISYYEFCNLLQYHTKNTEFQIESPKTPIQFLGLLEAAGRNFDVIWVTNVSDNNWPQPKNPNQFIPVALQKQYNLPHSSSERELEFSTQITNSFTHSAAQVVFSYGKLNKDLPQYCSQLTKCFPVYTVDDNIITYNKKYKKTEPIPEEPLVLPKYTNASTALITQQAECPFKAFANLRLQTNALPTSTYGISYQERGLLLHAMLEKIYQQETHLESNLNKQSNKIRLIIQSIINSYFSKYFISNNNNLLNIEQQRLYDLALEWLKFENNLHTPDIQTIENKQAIDIDGITFNLRVDRIDKVDGVYAIIDYKSTNKTNIDWFSNRPDLPQLILYALSAKHDIRALILAQVKHNNMHYVGIASNDINLPGVTTTYHTTWKQQLQSWQQILTNIVRAFNSGIADVDPKNISVCLNCNYQPLCRIHEVNNDS